VALPVTHGVFEPDTSALPKPLLGYKRNFDGALFKMTKFATRENLPQLFATKEQVAAMYDRLVDGRLQVSV